jgi:protein TonB
MERVPTPIPTQTSAEPPPEPAKPVFGVSMSSTVDSGQGAFAVRVGNTVAKAPEKEITDPNAVKPLPQVSFQQLEEAPRILRDFRAEYPAGPRAEGVEGTVILKLTIGADGRVTEAKVVRGIHPDLDEAARAAARQFLFSPGKVSGQAVVTTNFVYRYTWLIDE